MTARTVIKIPMVQRPNYHTGQLLLETDFNDEQQFHVEARKRHHLHLHGWGVVRGLAITRAGDKLISISGGVAVDEFGREIFLNESSTADLSTFGPNDRINVCLANEEELSGSNSATRSTLYAAVKLADESDTSIPLILGTVTLDGQGKVNEKAIDYTRTKYVRLAADSITAPALKGWLRLPFRASPLVDIPDGEKSLPPAFRVGATRTLSPDHDDAAARDSGAGGTMAIPLPPNATEVTRFRIAGLVNEGEIKVLLYAGGWDMEKNDHYRKILHSTTIASEKKSSSGDTRFVETFDIKEAKLDAEFATLGVWLRGTRKTSISLIAVELAYYT